MTMSRDPPGKTVQVVYLLRDRSQSLVDAWAEAFSKDTDRVKVKLHHLHNALAAHMLTMAEFDLVLVLIVLCKCLEFCY